MTDPMSAICGRRLRRYRLDRGMTLKAVAEAVTAEGRPMTLNTLSRIETGTRGHLLVDEAVPLCKVLQVEVSDLVAPQPPPLRWEPPQ